MTGLNTTAKEILTFIPSVVDFDIAKKFYQEIGFEVDYEDKTLAIMRKDRCRFFLQNNPNNWIAGNFMMVLNVEDLDAWWSMWGLPTRRDHERTLHKLNQLESQLYDLQERLDRKA